MAISPFIKEVDLNIVATAEADLREKVKQAEAEQVTVFEIDPDTATLAEMRTLLKALLVEKQAKEKEALGIDAYSHLPVFFDKPECPRCQPFSEHWRDPKTGSAYAVCHDCSKPIPHSIEFQNRGIESITVDHMHLHTINGPGRGAQIRVPVKRELCLPCFRLDWAKANPDKPCDL